MSEASGSPPAKPGAAVRRARFPRAKPNLLEAGRRIGPAPPTPTSQKSPVAVEVEIKNPPPVRRITRFTPVLGSRTPISDTKRKEEAPVQQQPIDPADIPGPPIVTPESIQPVVIEEPPSTVSCVPPEPAAVVAPAAPARRRQSEVDSTPADVVPPPPPPPALETPSPPLGSVAASSNPATLMPPPPSPSASSTVQPKTTAKTVAASSDQSQTSSTIKQRKRKLSSRGGESAEAIAKRRKYKKGAEPPEKSKMTMFDLIHWNPSKNPMTYEDDDDDVAVPLSSVGAIESTNEERLAEERVDDPGVEKSGANDEEECMPMPRVKIGADGSIVLDEQSLVIETTKSKNDLSSSPAVYERSSHTTYASYRKKRPTRYWSDRETTRFYVALSTVGTDFSMMLNLFPKRTRHELKTKFKKEDRVNKFLVDKAINDRQQYNLSIFEDDDELNLDEEEAEAEEIRKAKAECKARGRQRKSKPAVEAKKPKSKRRVRLQDESDESESELDETKLSDGTAADDKEEEEEEAENQPVENEDKDGESECNAKDENESSDKVEEREEIPKPTRSGRQPKRKSVFTISIDAPRRRAPRRPSPAAIASRTLTGTDEEERDPDAPQLVFFAENPTANGSQKVHMLLVSPQAGAPRTHPVESLAFGAAPPLSTPIRATEPVTPTSPPTPDHVYALASLPPVPVEGSPLRESNRTADCDTPLATIRPT